MPKTEFTPLVEAEVHHDDQDSDHLTIISKPIRRRQHVHCRSLFDSWAPEGIALALSILALIGIAVILITYNGRPLSSWPHSISLNTILSTLGTAMKGCLMVTIASCLGQSKWLWFADRKHPLLDFQVFDQASRGPWGSLVLLIQLKMRHLSCIGASVTLLALLSGPFIQQSVSYPLRPAVQRHLISFVPFTQRYDSYITTVPTALGGDEGTSEPTVEEPVLAAFYDGALASNLSQSSASLKAICPSGDCTFPPYASLGVCSQCANVSSLIKSENATSISPFWALPNGLTASDGDDQAFGATIANMSTTFGLNSNALSKYQSWGTITNFSMIRGNWKNSDAAGEFLGPSATDCVLYFCARSYNSSVSSSIYHENVTNSFNQPVWNINADDSTGLRLDPETYDIGSFVADLPNVKGQNLNFSVRIAARNALSLLCEPLGGEIYEASLLSPGYTFTNDVTKAFYYRGLNFTGVSNMMANISLALTNTIRQSPISETTIQGTTYAPETFIAVHGLWLLLPMTLELLALLYFLLTIAHTKRSDLPIWRVSALTTMEHGVNTAAMAEDDLPETKKPEMIGAAADGKETVTELEQWAKHVEVRLQKRGRNASAYGLIVT